MAEIVFSATAIRNIREIIIYNKDYPHKINSLENKIGKGVEILSLFPKAGKIEPLTQDYPGSSRSLVVDRDYKLFYEIQGNTVLIISVWNCQQNPLNIFDLLQK